MDQKTHTHQTLPVGALTVSLPAQHYERQASVVDEPLLW